MDNICDPSVVTELSPLQTDREDEVLKLLSERRQERLAAETKKMTAGDKVADKIASTVGSWKFIIVQSVIFIIWMALNIIGIVSKWDPYPFILLNLVLSFQSAYAGPIIMMSQNRQGIIDRKRAEFDYDTNLKAELEIEWLHQKMDFLRSKEFKELRETIDRLTDALNREKTVTENLSEALADKAG